MFGPHKIIASVAERQYGVLSQKQPVHKGFSRTAIQQRVADGRWRRVRSGVYAIAGVPKTFEGSLASAVLQIGDAFASHRTAAVLFALDGVRPLMRPELIVFDPRYLVARSDSSSAARVAVDRCVLGARDSDHECREDVVRSRRSVSST